MTYCDVMLVPMDYSNFSLLHDVDSLLGAVAVSMPRLMRINLSGITKRDVVNDPQVNG